MVAAFDFEEDKFRFLHLPDVDSDFYSLNSYSIRVREDYVFGAIMFPQAE